MRRPEGILLYDTMAAKFGEKMDEPWPFRIESFITEVERNRFLYDKEHPSYCDEEMKQRVWDAIGRRHDMKGAQCKTFWLSICTRYITALKIVQETNYIPEERILHSQNLKFMEKHFKDFVLDPVDENLVKEITQEIKLEIETENNNDGIPKNLQMILRQVKLKKWTDTPLMKRYNSERIPQYRRMVDAMVEIIKEAIRRREALKKKQTQRQSG